MKYISIAAAALLLAGCGQLTTSQIVDRVKPGTVLISNQLDTSSGGIGTGFIIAENTIITNDHVVAGNGTITIYAPDGSKRYDAEVLHKDPISDIAVVKLKDWESFAKEKSPNILSLGDSDTMNEGSKVIIIGHPWGLTWSISEGIISSKNRRQGSNPQYLDQVDAHLFQGNSGGPVFNEDGEVICVSDKMLKGEGGSYGFCIPSNLVKKVLNDFDKFKEVRWRALNVGVSLTEDGSSVILSSVEPKGAADLAGLKENDKVLEIYTAGNHPAGKKIVDTNDLITELASLNGNEETVKLLIERNGEKKMVEVKTNYKVSKDYAQVN